MSYRIFQINELIQKELGNIIIKEFEFPKDCLGTITEVETSKDLRHAKIWISIFPIRHAKKALQALQKKSPRLQFMLNKRLHMKPLPQIRFVQDTTGIQAHHIDEALDKL